MSEPSYSDEDIRPLLDALWFIAHTERSDSEAVDALTARQHAREALQKFGVSLNRELNTETPTQTTDGRKRYRPEPLV